MPKEVSRIFNKSNLTCNNSVLFLILLLLQSRSTTETISTFLRASCSSNVSLSTLFRSLINSIFDTTTIFTLGKTMAARRLGKMLHASTRTHALWSEASTRTRGEKSRLELVEKSLVSNSPRAKRILTSCSRLRKEASTRARGSPRPFSNFLAIPILSPRYIEASPKYWPKSLPVN